MSDDVQVTVVGGVTRVQHGADDSEQELASAPETARDYSNTLRVNAADFQGPKGFGILSTARSSFGGPTLELKPDTVVEYQGLSMKLEQAEQLGLVKRDSHGGYSEIGADERRERARAQDQRERARQPQPEPGDVREMQPEPLPPAVEQALGKLVEGV